MEDDEDEDETDDTNEIQKNTLKNQKISDDEYSDGGHSSERSNRS
jgi:hypothetical protein